MNSSQIHRLLDNLLDPARVEFAGVFPRDKIPDQSADAKRFPYCYVANTDNSSEPGSHWVAFYFSDPVSCEFFDSYGLHPIADYHFRLRALEDLQMSKHSYQSYASDVCGHFVVYFLSRRALNFPFLTILDSFLKGSPEYNDLLVRQFVRRRAKIRSYLPDIVRFHSSVCSHWQSCIARSSLQASNFI